MATRTAKPSWDPPTTLSRKGAGKPEQQQRRVHKILRESAMGREHYSPPNGRSGGSCRSLTIIQNQRSPQPKPAHSIKHLSSARPMPSGCRIHWSAEELSTKPHCTGLPPPIAAPAQKTLQRESKPTVPWPSPARA